MVEVNVPTVWSNLAELSLVLCTLPNTYFSPFACFPKLKTMSFFWNLQP